MLLFSPLHGLHKANGAKTLTFHNWQMPLHYGSQIDEHNATRNKAGIFDVSHMLVTDIEGPDRTKLLNLLLASNVNKLKTSGKALYSVMLNEQGGIIDDLIAYSLETNYRLVSNCGTRERVSSWLKQQASGMDVNIQQQTNLAIIALQGPEFLKILEQALGTDMATTIGSLKPFTTYTVAKTLFAKTGYTGEKGVEIILPTESAQQLWLKLMQAGAVPAGLGARDTLRLEAGLNLYGQDMDELKSPLQSNLGWTIAWQPEDRNFIGRQALLQEKKAGVQRYLTGLILDQKGIARTGYKVFPNNTDNSPCGEITSGIFAPTINKSIALVRVNNSSPKNVFVEIRTKRIPAHLVKPPFYRSA